jgi:hypothetical protein
MQTSDFIALIALAASLYAVWMQNKGVKEQILAQNKGVKEQILAQNEGVKEQLLVANISTYTKRYQEIVEKLPKSIIDENFNLSSLSQEEQEKILRPVWLYFDLCYEEYMLYHDFSLIDEKLWMHWEAGMISAFNRPAFYQCWEYIFKNSFYPKSFNKFVNDKMSELHNKARSIKSSLPM